MFTNKDCKYTHAERTCAQFNKYGKCNDEPNCNYRHPKSVFKFLSEKGNCKKGDLCKFRHPKMNERNQKHPERTFLDGQTKGQTNLSPLHNILHMYPLPLHSQNGFPSCLPMNTVPLIAPPPPPQIRSIHAQDAVGQSNPAANHCSALQGACSCQVCHQ